MDTQTCQLIRLSLLKFREEQLFFVIKEKNKNSTTTTFSARELRHYFVLARMRNRNQFIHTLPQLCTGNHSITQVFEVLHVQSKPREIHWFNGH